MRDQASPESGPAARDDRARVILNAVLALLVCLIWWLRYGQMGPYYDADGALAGAMALRPWGGEFIYQWGGTHIGSIVPLLAIPLVRLGVDAHVASQISVYLVAGTGIGLLLAHFRRWPFAICFAALLAFPSAGIADTLCQTWCHIPGALLFFGLELLFWRRAALRPTPVNAGLTALMAVLTVWAADNAIIFYAPQGLLLLGALWRQRHSPRLRGIVLGALVGAAPAVLLIAAGKRLGQAKANYYTLNGVAGVIKGLSCMGRAGFSLIPQIPFELFRASLVALFALSMVLIWRERSRALSSVSPLALIGTAPLLGLVATCFSAWYTDSCSPRYIGLWVVMGELALCLFADQAQLWMEARWPARRGMVMAGFAAVAALIAVGSGWVNCGHNHDFVDWPYAIGGGGGELGPERGLHWREKVAAALRQGCQGMVAPYWDSYPYFELSNGKILGTDREGDFIQVREPSLGVDAVHTQAVCVVPWWGGLRCPADLLEFGVTLTDPVLVQDQANGHPIAYCKYRGDPR